MSCMYFLEEKGTAKDLIPVKSVIVLVHLEREARGGNAAHKPGGLFAHRQKKI